MISSAFELRYPPLSHPSHFFVYLALVYVTKINRLGSAEESSGYIRGEPAKIIRKHALFDLQPAFLTASSLNRQ